MTHQGKAVNTLSFAEILQEPEIGSCEFQPARYVLRPGQTVVLRFDLSLLYDLAAAQSYNLAVSATLTSGDGKKTHERLYKVEDLPFNVTDPALVEERKTLATAPPEDAKGATTKPAD